MDKDGARNLLMYMAIVSFWIGICSAILVSPDAGRLFAYPTIYAIIVSLIIGIPNGDEVVRWFRALSWIGILVCAWLIVYFGVNGWFDCILIAIFTEFLLTLMLLAFLIGEEPSKKIVNVMLLLAFTTCIGLSTYLTVVGSPEAGLIFTIPAIASLVAIFRVPSREFMIKLSDTLFKAGLLVSVWILIEFFSETVEWGVILFTVIMWLTITVIIKEELNDCELHG